MSHESQWWEPLAVIREEIAQEAREEAWDLLEIERSKVRLADRIAPGSELEAGGGQVVVVRAVQERLHGAIVVSAVRSAVLVREDAIVRARGLVERLAGDDRELRTIGSWLREHVGLRMAITLQGQRLTGILEAVFADHVDLRGGAGIVSVAVGAIEWAEVDLPLEEMPMG